MREATVKYVEVINGVKSEHNLCAHCAGLADMGQYSALFEGEFTLGKLLSGLLGIPDTSRDEAKYAGVVCPSCGTTYEDFVKDSRFGCADCYSVFDPLISENIKHLQGNERHVGKRPKGCIAALDSAGESHEKKAEDAHESTENRLTGEERIRLLSARLKDAVRREDYEAAAALRDEIRGLKEEINQDGKVV